MMYLPASFDEVGLRAAGYEGFETVGLLRSTRLEIVPREMGVYMIMRDDGAAPSFLRESTGGWFKGRDPSVADGILKAKWIKSARVVYIGKAGSEAGSATLRSRLKQLFDLGAGKAVGHWGGRYLWHLPDADASIVCWRVSKTPRTEEIALLTEFARQHGGLPFANLVS